jgi:hypothetical protein
MHEVGLIEVESSRGVLSLPRWTEFVRARPQFAKAADGEWINELHFQHPHCWPILDGNACIGSLTWKPDHQGSDESGYLVVASVSPDSEAVFPIAWSLADELGGTYHPCSSRFLEIMQMTSQPGAGRVKIHFNDGKVFLAELAYCDFWRDAEHVYFCRIDPEALGFEEGLYSVGLDKIASIVPADAGPRSSDSSAG